MHGKLIRRAITVRRTAVLCFSLLFFPTLVTAKPVMVVPTGLANDAVVIDLEQDRVTDRVPELENAHGLASNANSDYLVAGSMASGGNGSGKRPVAVGEAEHAAHHAGEGKGAAGAPASHVAIIDSQTHRVVRRIGVRGLTHHTAVSSDGKVAVAVHSGAGGISVIDLAAMAVQKELQTGRSPNYAVFSRSGERLYVSNALSGTVSEIDTAGWQIIREIAVGRQPEHMVFSNGRLYVANVGDGQVAVVDLKQGKVVARHEIGRKPHGLDVSDDGRWLFAASKGDGKVVRIDLRDGGRQVLDLQPTPYHLEYVDEVGKLYVSSRKAPKIWVIDPQTLTVRGEIGIGAGVAHQMVVLGR